jgi:cephalosporin hydroxylase
MEIVKNFGNSPSVTISYEGKQVTFDLYSDIGREYINLLALKQAVYNKAMYEYNWLGIKIIQFPHDLLIYQQILDTVRPSVVIETGVAHGGLLIFAASVLESLNVSAFKIVGIDIEIREHNRTRLKSHKYFNKLILKEASSVSQEASAFCASEISDEDKVLVVLDSNHSYEHVRKELEIYAKFVTKDSYIIAMDGALGLVGDVPGQDVSAFTDNPVKAIDEFLQKYPQNFVQEDIFEKNATTSSPRGALRCVKPL